MRTALTLRRLFTVNFFIALFFGGSCAFFPAWALRIYGLVPEAGAIWTTRLVGGSILGFATLMLYGRGRASAEAGKAIAFALFVQDLLGFFASLEIQLRGNLNALGWSNPVLYGLLALGYGYFAFRRPADG